MNKMKYIYLIAFLLITNVLHAHGVSVKVSHDEIEVGETALVTYTLKGNVESFVQPKFNGFQVYQTGQSTHKSIINGQVSKSISYSFTLVGLEVGTFEINPAKAKIDGELVQSASFTVRVTPSSGHVAPSQPNSTSKEEVISSSSDNWEDDIILLATVDKNKAYVGEQVTITYKLLRRLNLQSLSIEKLPMYKGFLLEEMEIPRNQSEGVMTYQGKKFHFEAFRKVALFASQAGTYTIEPLVSRGVALVPEKDRFFGTTFFITTVPQEIQVLSNSLKIEVIDLPIVQQPKNFSGAVGEFKVKRNITPQRIAQGESAKMEINVTGWGNLKAITQPVFIQNKDFDIYDPKTTDQVRKNGEKYGGTRTFDYSIVPHQSGDIVIPSYEFVYFDPEKKAYITNVLPEVTLRVDEGNTLLGNDRQVAFDSSLKSSLSESKSNYTLPILGVVVGLPLLALIGLFVWKRKTKATEGQDIKGLDWPDLSQYVEKEQYSVFAKALRIKLKEALHPEATTDYEILNKIKDSSLRQKIAFVLVSCDRAAYSPMLSSSVQELEKMGRSAFAEISNSTQA